MPTPLQPDSPAPADRASSASPAGASGGLPGGADEVLVALVAEALEGLQREGPAALEALCRRHPERAAQLRERIERLARAGFAEVAAGELPERLGPFRILSPLGGGGMGLVVRAEQEGLGRPVALKLVRPELLHVPGARQRFQREIAAVARLQHPGIVPVYAGGEAGGIPYFAMELVDGASLDEVLAELAGRDPAQLSGADLAAAIDAVCARRQGRRAAPDGEPRKSGTAAAEAAARLFGGSWSAACLRIARQVAEALEHAHERGVLHRDVKPSNVLLTATGRVLLIDFGLAAAEGSERLTASGSQQGSLAWMSPEQVRGEHGRLDARTDVYSLGATLAELLLLRSPFVGADAEATRRNILAGRPVSLRAQLPGLPRDAETVCQVALDRDRERRYASAAAFGEDLGRVLDRRPILARRPGWVRRGRRWAERRPAATVGVGLGALLLLAGPVGWELNRRQTIETLQQARLRSDRHFEISVAAIGQLLRGLAVDGMQDVPRMQQARLAAIDGAVGLFEVLQRDRPEDRLVIGEGAALHASRGDVLADLGRPEQALEAFELAIALRRRQLALAPERAAEHGLADALSRAGKALDAMARHGEARPLHEEALERLRPLAAATAHAPTHPLNFAVALANLGWNRASLGELEAAEALHFEAAATVAAVRAAWPDDAHAHWTEGRIFADLGHLAGERGQHDQRAEWAARALAGYRAAAAASPEQRYYQLDVSTGLVALGRAVLELGEFTEAEAAFAEALARVDELLRDFPDSARYRRLRIEILDVFALCAGYQQQHERAFGMFEASLAGKEQLCAQQPERCDLAVDATNTLINMANALIQQVTELERALELLDRAEQHLLPCHAQDPPLPVVLSVHGTVRYMRALGLCLADRLEAAGRAIEDFEAALPAEPLPLSLRRGADLWNEWILALRRTEPDAAARAARETAGRARMLALLRAALDAGYADLAELSHTAALDSFRGDPEFVALLATLQADG